MKNNKFDNALKKVSDFIELLVSVGERSGSLRDNFFIFWADEGILFLSDKEAVLYRECLKLLHNAVGDEIVSQNEIEHHFQKAILTIVDIQKRRNDTTYISRLEIALKELRKSLIAHPQSFTVYYPVNGLAFDGLPIDVGNVFFCKFDDDHLARFIKPLSEYEGTAIEKKNRSVLIDSIKKSEIIGKPVGLIKVKAIDSEAAKSLALKELTLTLNIINFFSDLIPYQKGFLYLPGDDEQRIINVPVISQDSKTGGSFGWEVVGPLAPLSLQQLLDNDKERKLGFSKSCDLLVKNRNKLEARLVSSLQWAGKATVENKKEEAFLLYAIALESLILLDSDFGELTYRLRTRVAHLLGNDTKSRIKIFEDIGELYGERSKIVHNGWYQVTDSSLRLMRFYSKECIIRILISEPFSSMTSVKSLVDWFTRQILN